MKVVHVVRQFLPSRGGLEEAILKLSMHQARRHHCDIRVITLNRLFSNPHTLLPSREIVNGVQVERISFYGSRRYPIAPAVLSHLGEADLVHVHAVDFFFDFLALTKSLHRKRLIATTHGGFFHTSFAAAFKRLYFASVTRAASSRYDRIIACSDSDASAFRRIAPGKVVTIENGVDLDKLRARASGGHRHTMIYFGRLSSNKRIGRIFPILRRLREGSPDWRLIIAGSEYDIAVGPLREEALRCGVAAAVDFVDSPNDDALAALVGNATYFISASAYEGFGIAALEAMSAGLIPILSRIPPFEALIEKAQAGLVIDPVQPETAACSVLDFDQRLDATLQIEQERVIRFVDTRDWAQVADAYVDQYEIALAQGYHS
jgi:alpha-1,3-mannosyltransferase